MNQSKSKLDQIPINLIDDPVVPIRTKMDNEKLWELGQSIKKVGLIQPIKVVPRGERFEVIAGHRRLSAAKMVNLDLIDCIVEPMTPEQASIVKVHENLFREDVNPVDEAMFMEKAIQDLDVTVPDFAVMINRSVSYVRDHLDILHFDPDIMLALKQKKLKLVAAKYLNRITDPIIRRDYLEFAKRGGITGHIAQAWYASWKGGQLPSKPEASKVENPITHEQEEIFQVECELCGVKSPLDRLRLYYCHPECMERYHQAMAKFDEKKSTPLKQQSDLDEAK